MVFNLWSPYWILWEGSDLPGLLCSSYHSWLLLMRDHCTQLLALILGILLHCSPINFLSWKDVLKTTLFLEVGYWHAAGLGQISEWPQYSFLVKERGWMVRLGPGWGGSEMFAGEFLKNFVGNWEILAFSAKKQPAHIWFFDGVEID